MQSDRRDYEVQPRFDFDVVHTPEVVLVRVYYYDQRGALAPHAEVKLSAGANFPHLYDTFRREHKWPTVEEVEGELLDRYRGASEERSHHTEAMRRELASKDLAEFFKVWLVLRGRGEVIAQQQAQS